MAAPSSANVFAAAHRVTAEERAKRFAIRGSIYWLTGLSGAGKSTIAMGTEQRLFADGHPAYVLDGDNLRRGISSDLGFSGADRVENIRRAGEIAALFADAGMIVIVALISPYRAERQRVRQMAPAGIFHEIYIEAPVEICESRDPKGLYRRARAGEIPEFTGISAPYEPPDHPELLIRTDNSSADACVAQLADYIRDQSKLPL